MGARIIMASINKLTEQDLEIIINKLFVDNKQFYSIEDAYQHLAQSMYDYFKQDHKSDLVLSRVYHSLDFLSLPNSLQEIAKQGWGDKTKKTSKFMTLMGTYGEKDEWCDRKKSQGHRTILLTQDTIANIPMVARLLQQIGFDLGALLNETNPGAEYSGISGTFGVFYVAPALGSPYIPAQDFVKDYGVQSVLGTGIMTPSGEIAVYIGFSRVHVESEVAANIASLMSLFWQQAFSLREERGMFNT